MFCLFVIFINRSQDIEQDEMIQVIVENYFCEGNTIQIQIKSLHELKNCIMQKISKYTALWFL